MSVEVFHPPWLPFTGEGQIFTAPLERRNRPIGERLQVPQWHHNFDQLWLRFNNKNSHIFIGKIPTLVVFLLLGSFFSIKKVAWCGWERAPAAYCVNVPTGHSNGRRRQRRYWSVTQEARLMLLHGIAFQVGLEIVTNVDWIMADSQFPRW